MDVVGFAPGWSRIPGPATGNLTSDDGESWRWHVPHGFFGVNIGLILPRLFKFSETVKKNDVFLHHFPKLTTCRLLCDAV